ncbi:hypothetical protein UF75_1029 [Desulfosporosinus sp. I2]|nr:hypothetical protein UF75_1029 [Desulfosporosinus sp. I2]
MQPLEFEGKRVENNAYTKRIINISRRKKVVGYPPNCR